MSDTADIRDHPEQNREHEGASLSEQVVEACRRNNTELLTEIIESCTSPEAAARLLNTSKSAMGNFAYHEAALRAHYEIIDLMLDQEGFEVDPINAREGDTPLHCVVRYINEHEEDQEYGEALVRMMMEAGSDPRIRNKAHLKPYDLVDPRNTKLREVFTEGEYVRNNEGDFINVADTVGEEDDGPTGSASDSDFEEEVNGKK